MNEVLSCEKGLSEIICFYCNNVLMAVDLFKVVEIAHVDKILRIPHSAYYIEGIVNLRGEVTPIVNLRRRFHFPVFPIDSGVDILVYDYDGNNRMAMIIDGIDRVYNVKDLSYTKASPLIKKKGEGFVDGYYIIDDKVITVLDTEKIVSSKELSLALSGGSAGDVDEDDLGELKKLETEIDETLNDILKDIPDEVKPKEGIVPELKSVTQVAEEQMYKLTLSLEKMLISVDEQLEIAPKLSKKLFDISEETDRKKIDEFLKITGKMQETIFNTMIHLQFQDIVRQKLEKVLHSIQGISSSLKANYNLKEEN